MLPLPLAAATSLVPSLEEAMAAQLALPALDCCQEELVKPEKLPMMDWLVFCKTVHPPAPAPEMRMMSPRFAVNGSRTVTSSEFVKAFAPVKLLVPGNVLKPVKLLEPVNVWFVF